MEENEGKYLNNKVNPGYILALVLLLASMFFLSPNITGNTIGTMNNTYSSFFSLVLFVSGLATFMIMKKR